MNQEQALLQLAKRSAAAAGESLAGRAVTLGQAARLEDDSAPGTGLAFPLVVCHSEYAEGTAGGTLIALSPAAAAAVQGVEDGAALDVDALAPLLRQMLERSTTITSTMVGAAVEVVEPRTEICNDPNELAGTYHSSTYTTVIDGQIDGHPFRFVQAVPHSLVVQLMVTLAKRDVEHVDLTAQEVGERIGIHALQEVPLHCSIELGSTSLPVQRAGRLRQGEVVALDQADSDPLVLCLSGRPYAKGYLRPTASGELEFEITEILR